MDQVYVGITMEDVTEWVGARVLAGHLLRVGVAVVERPAVLAGVAAEQQALDSHSLRERAGFDPPDPVPSGSPPWIMNPGMIRWKIRLS